ncbi:hypothetical protein H5410_004764 [Solanum commersonii]|uniref:Uncharacterized protein n=1 Tax=Solanum commersonii TaxID=4109 RepID=A0A9J6A596_SOLCO|nr:hypothetical protein H5410_004764 [Solanum commersonii]
MKSKQTKDDTPPTYSTILVDEESTEVFDQNIEKEVILFLENSDLRWKHDPWQLMTRYLDSSCYTTTVYKYKMHYEMILSSTGLGEFQHFYPAKIRKVYNFSKIIIKRVITPEEWGMSPLKERDYIHPKQKIVVKYNYWDYVDNFNKALLYENANRKHSWFIKICANVFTQPIPNWFCKWWTLYGPSIKILLDQYKNLYSEWIDISPKLIKFSIPWIMKWNVAVNITSKKLPCLQRTFYTKFWSKLISKDLGGKIHGQEILDLIARKIHMKKGIISRLEAIALYMEEVKKDLIKNLDIDIEDDIFMTSASHTNQDDEACIVGEAQSDHNIEEIDIDALFKQFEEQVEKSSNKPT